MGQDEKPMTSPVAPKRQGAHMEVEPRMVSKTVAGSPSDLGWGALCRLRIFKVRRIGKARNCRRVAAVIAITRIDPSAAVQGDMLNIDEAYWNSWLRWHLYRKFRKRPRDAFKGALLRLRKLLRELPEGALAIDCGANVGDVTAFLLSKGLKVIAFEPDPTALGVLRSRFPSGPELTIEGKAVGAKPGRAPFYQTQSVSSGEIAETIASSLMRRDVHGSAPVSEVEIVDLVAYIQALPEPVRILKLDIEGYEAEVLEAILDAQLDRRIDLILVETHEQFSPELARRLGAIRERIAAGRIDNICLGWR